MSISVVAPKTGRIKATAQSSPRLLIYTDASQVERVPEIVRRAADIISTEDLDAWKHAPFLADAQGAIVWMDGDELRRGASAELRAFFFSARAASHLVPVHLPCLEEADLIGLQPRLFTAPVGKGAGPEKVTFSIRIAGAQQPSALALHVLKSCPEPWAELYLALLCQSASSGGLLQLRELWQKRKLSPLFASLLLRNLIVALLRQKQASKAEELLTLALKAYPGYAELDYLSAVLWLQREKVAKAVPHLERAMRVRSGEYVGSGGESSYRASWLLGAICEKIGDQERALSHFIPGIYQRPAFLPSLQAILRQRVSRFRAEQLHQPLGELVRREPMYLGPVFDFFLRHHVLGPPRRLLQTLPLFEEARQTLQARLSSAERRLHPTPLRPAEKAGVALEGSFLILSSHARINHAIASRLLDTDSLDVTLEPTEAASGGPQSLRQRSNLNGALGRTTARLDLTIRHQWPPDFRQPASGQLACIVPWEHRAVPRAWVREIESAVDELWVPSDFVADAFARGGVSPHRLQVIPNGFAPEVFHPGVPPWRPRGCRSCVFLFVGGTIRRKGADLLLQAYADAFSEDDDVTLVFKDTGANTFYRHNNLLSQAQKMGQRPDTAPIIILKDEIDDAALAALYRGCDALVLPYRGEGFGMPLLEGMACGRPVVTTNAGPAPEFCPPEFSYLLPAAEVPVTEPPPPFGEFTSPWTWFEPDLTLLAEALRSIYENRAEAARRGQLAAERVLRTHAWSRITGLYLDRIRALTANASAPEISASALSLP